VPPEVAQRSHPHCWPQAPQQPRHHRWPARSVGMRPPGCSWPRLRLGHSVRPLKCALPAPPIRMPAPVLPAATAAGPLPLPWLFSPPRLPSAPVSLLAAVGAAAAVAAAAAAASSCACARARSILTVRAISIMAAALAPGCFSRAAAVAVWGLLPPAASLLSACEGSSRPRDTSSWPRDPSSWSPSRMRTRGPPQLRVLCSAPSHRKVQRSVPPLIWAALPPLLCLLLQPLLPPLPCLPLQPLQLLVGPLAGGTRAGCCLWTATQHPLGDAQERSAWSAGRPWACPLLLLPCGCSECGSPLLGTRGSGRTTPWGMPCLPSSQRAWQQSPRLRGMNPGGKRRRQTWRPRRG